jgi:hypothetical protein
MKRYFYILIFITHPIISSQTIDHRSLYSLIRYCDDIPLCEKITRIEQILSKNPGILHSTPLPLVGAIERLKLHPELVELLLIHGADPNHPESAAKLAWSRYQSYIEYPAYYHSYYSIPKKADDYKKIILLLARFGGQFNQPWNYGITRPHTMHTMQALVPEIHTRQQEYQTKNHAMKLEKEAMATFIHEGGQHAGFAQDMAQLLGVRYPLSKT